MHAQVPRAGSGGGHIPAPHPCFHPHPSRDGRSGPPIPSLPGAPQHPPGVSPVPSGDPPGTHPPSPSPSHCLTPRGHEVRAPPQGRCPGIPSLGGRLCHPGPPFVPHIGVGTCSALGGPNSLPRLPLSIPGDSALFPGSSLCPGGPQSHQGRLHSHSMGSSPCLRGSYLPFEGATLYSSYPLLCSEGPCSLQGFSTPHGVLTLSWGVLASFPGLPFPLLSGPAHCPGDVFSLEDHPPPFPRLRSLFPGVPPSAQGVPCPLRELSTPFPVVLFSAPGFPLGL